MIQNAMFPRAHDSRDRIEHRDTEMHVMMAFLYSYVQSRGSASVMPRISLYALGS